jgi:hypothetical protein
MVSRESQKTEKMYSSDRKERAKTTGEAERK